MKVKELIEKLQKEDPEAVVVLIGYNSGFEDIFEVVKETVTGNYGEDKGKKLKAVALQ